ncbi:RelA/SpoT domain-containing protein [Bdellovibrio bacteriovorus]|uniref:RelA/SpoT domain-containing protein n=1 Tax=Bdellovibrio bacteriovorus str. Tiberius TaxID=1069642 RepID=K7YZA9_BDEBC|nr:RelA/SpoT domain-containing protein [Bdellovibrio bacteriovorus]AFY03083.1 RelA/SpoT domain-containing protein [Bdellovibrio bacteriovorus str. Tiberius]
MGSVELEYSKAKIDRAGELLKSKSGSDEEIASALEVLSSWRAYHAIPLDSFAAVLRQRIQKISDRAIAAQRLKRTPSILLKLSNHKTMRLSAMQDIGGLRAILESTEEVYELLGLYKRSKSKHALFSLDDYIENPKPDGYRSIHLVYKLSKTPSLFLELQFRSQLQHIWATGVEVFGTLQNSSFKSGQGNRRWLEFFALLSSVFAIKESKPILKAHKEMSKLELIEKVQKEIRELHVIENLSVYTAAYKTISKSSSKGRKGHYSLILLNSRENTISLETYGASQFDAAVQAYLDLERKYFEDTLINVVLVNTGDLKKLEMSYPNYFMDTKTLVQNLSLIMMGKFF